jgi:hypothetical protein
VQFAVPVEVQRRHPQQVRVVTEQAEAVVAPLTQQPSDLPGYVIVIEVLGPRCVTDGAPVKLLGTKGVYG